MKFMVELKLKPGGKNKLLEAFDLRGPNRYPGVSFRDAWIDTRSELMFILGESNEESLVAQACETWREHGEFTIHPVISVDQV
ncbi:MAG: DUF3303 family protein [Pirellulales bacterium]|nr:DUF3303 family protein [Pirellulales bacterium]